MIKHRQLLFKFTGLLAFLLLCAGVFGTAKVQAFSAANIHPNPGPVQLPAYFENALVSDCNRLPAQSPATNAWISPVGNPAAPGVNVAYGQKSVNLQVNTILANCWPNQDAAEVYFLYDNARDGAGGSFSGINNSSSLLDAKPSNDVGHFDEKNFTFAYRPQNGFYGSGVINITVDVYPAYHSRLAPGNIYQCISGGAMSPFGFSFIKFPRPVGCNPITRSFSIFVNVGPAPSGSVINLSCTKIQGWAVDGDNMNKALRYVVYKDNPFFTAPVITGTANGKDPNNPLAPRYPGTDPSGNIPGTIPGYHGFDVDISAYQDTSVHHFYVAVYNVDQFGNEPPGELPTYINLSPPNEATNSPGQPCLAPIMTCSAPGYGILDPTTNSDLGSTIEASQAFKVKFGVSYNGPQKPGSTGTVTIYHRNPDGSNGAALAPPGTMGPFPYTNASGTLYTATTGSISTNTTGQYNVVYTFTYTGASGPLPPQSCRLTIVQKPYFRVYGNDVQAGGAFPSGASSTCSSPANPAASIYTLGITFGPVHTGGGTQLAASALGLIEDFSSAATRNNLPPSDPHVAPNPAVGTTFGNKPDSGPVNFGGDSGISRCIPNYFSAGVDTAGNAKPGATVFGNNSCLGLTPAGVGCLTGPGGTNVVPKGVHLAIFIKGDVRIISDITFAGGAAGQSWANTDEMPSFYVIASGNIYIDPRVTQLDGTYISQGGTINTCYNTNPNVPTASVPSPVPTENLITTCSQPLKITGSFIANSVKFLRTRGTLLKFNGLNEDSNSNNLAEVFDFSQENYLAPLPSILNGVVGGSGPATQYDSITSLPPIL